MKITMYELLGLVKDDKAPKKVRHIGSMWEYDKDTKDYYSYDYSLYLIYSMNSIGLTETEVEIIEEMTEEEKYVRGWNKYCKAVYDMSNPKEKKIPEKIKDKYNSQISKVELAQKYNEIIDYLDYLKSKGDE